MSCQNGVVTCDQNSVIGFLLTFFSYLINHSHSINKFIRWGLVWGLVGETPTTHQTAPAPSEFVVFRDSVYWAPRRCLFLRVSSLPSCWRSVVRSKWAKTICPCDFYSEHRPILLLRPNGCTFVSGTGSELNMDIQPCNPTVTYTKRWQLRH